MGLVIPIFLVFIIAIIPVNEKFRFYSATFLFGFFIGEIFNSLFFGFKGIINDIINLFKEFKIHPVGNMVLIVFLLLILVFFAYYLVLLVKEADYLRPEVKIPWWFIFVGFAVDFIIYIFKKKIEKQKIGS